MPSVGQQSTAPTLPAVTAFGAVILVVLGLSIPFDASNAWVTHTAWAIFAVVAAALVTVPVVLRGSGRPARDLWMFGAVGAASVVAYWLLLVLPNVGSNQGFVLTLASAAAGVSIWASPARPR
jgi:hypothetical protein